jgi:formate dehydrogenase beta subunit
MRAEASNETNPKDHVAMLFDSTMCVGCNACTVACRQWNDTEAERSEDGLYDAPTALSADTWTLIQLYIEGEEYAFVKYACMHCIDPGCVSGCPVSALQKSADGPVTYDPTRCIGCRYCMYTCPFHVPRFEWDEVLPEITKCTMCYDRTQMGLGTACAERCPTGALIWGSRGELLAEAHTRIKAHPDRYLDYVYGEFDAGGTSVLYLSSVDFENLGLQDLGPDPVPELSEATSEFLVPAIAIAGPLALAMIRSVSKREGWEETWPF